MADPKLKKKITFLLRVYFGVSNNPRDDVNPYDDLNEFRTATVGDLQWGPEDEIDVRLKSKVRFAYNYNKALEQVYRIQLAAEDVFAVLLEESQTNEEAATLWAKKAVFPK
jgi:hypothetical protein